ncbi:histidinol dehydrogenase [Rhodothalassium salexigens]|uniref:histidinol dehydrogenase n=1 Tax=Rhodothalassium salexigens TaxID=1086 RepID=UPI0019132410|nr:histidinol dehydrogenase [Rhodothalassium salexigens]MBK5921863.1 histidinol dehydrogenase [Rhodothalassium salexigens]
MPLKLNSRDANFTERFRAFATAERAPAADVADTVRRIIARVRAEGDAALIDLTRQFDRTDLTAETLRVPQGDIRAARKSLNRKTLEALELAADRISAFHESEVPKSRRFTDAAGVSMGFRWLPVDAAGLYVPGGTAVYPSSVLMNALPAKVAGVKRLAMTVPTPDGHIDPLILTAADIAGVDEIYRVGGAQAIAALAYGTESVAPVDVITGPGNAYVAEAKRQVFGQVGIDSIAGPSEILVVADTANDPAVIAADLLSQAEHDPVAQAVLITDDADFAARVEAAVAEHLETLPRRDIAAASWAQWGAIILVEDLIAETGTLVDRLAPEHLALAVDDAEALADTIAHAGAIFLGRHTPEAVGDYVGGPNHVLPTGRQARFASGLGVADFMKRSTLLHCSRGGLDLIGPAAVTLADAEGLDAHARSVALRLGQMPEPSSDPGDPTDPTSDPAAR